LIVAKLERTYLSSDIEIPDSGQVFMNFNLLEDKIGCINQECIINFNNDLLLLNGNGIGRFTSASNSGGIYSDTYKFGYRINNLIREASQNINFINSFILHSAKYQTILFCMPENKDTIADQNYFLYPEIPNNFALCFEYNNDVLGSNIPVWSVKEGQGWAFAGGNVIDDEFILNGYFGNIYRLYDGDEYEKYPNQIEKNIITSRFISNKFTADSNQSQITIENISINWNVYGSGEYALRFIFYNDMKINFENSNKFKIKSINRLRGGDTAFYDGTNYDNGNVYADDINVWDRSRIAGRGRYCHIEINWNNFNEKNNEYILNIATFNGIAGTLQYLNRYN
jgi:hypothetical protein